MKKNNSSSIETHFKTIQDPRRHNKKHKLIDIITISICAVICGAEGFEHIEEFGKSKFKWLKQFLELPFGIPSHDTFGRIFAMLDPKEFQDCFIDWIQSIQDLMEDQIIAVDGKTLRRSFDKNSDKKAIHMVSAWASSNSVVLGQIKTAEKSNEITAIPMLLKMLDFSGSTVTIDAMGCQTKIATSIIDGNGDYVFSLKGNQSSLHDDVKSYFKDCIDSIFEDIPHSFHQTTDSGHGRIEKKEVFG